MSDEEREIDIESDDDDDGSEGANAATQFMTQAEKRAHHNALERKRRDHIKESFHSLRDSIPTSHGEKVRNASRAQILKQATDYIRYMSQKNGTVSGDIENLKKQNSVLEQQVRSLEKARATGTFAAQSSNSVHDKKNAYDEGSASASDSSETDPPTSRRKKPKLK